MDTPLENMLAEALFELNGPNPPSLRAAGHRYGVAAANTQNLTHSLANSHESAGSNKYRAKWPISNYDLSISPSRLIASSASSWVISPTSLFAPPSDSEVPEPRSAKVNPRFRREPTNTKVTKILGRISGWPAASGLANNGEDEQKPEKTTTKRWKDCLVTLGKNQVFPSVQQH